MGPLRPNPPATWRRYLRFWGSDPRRDLDDELRFHIESRYDEYVAAGMDPSQARTKVNQRFGDVVAVREACTAIDTQWHRERTMAELSNVAFTDLRYAVRQLRRNSALSVAAIVCFALGIGANTSIFSVVDAVLFRPLPFPDADRLVLVGDRLPKVTATNFGRISAAEYVDYRSLDGTVFDASAIFVNSSHVLMGQGEPERVTGARVSASLFTVLRISPPLGRSFAPDDDRVDGPDVVILSDALWRRKYGADPGLVGRSIVVDGRSATVAGVMPPGFNFPILGLGGEVAEIFTLYRLTPDVVRFRGDNFNTIFIARLARGVTLDRARSAVAEMARRLPVLYPEAYVNTNRDIVGDAMSLREQAVGGVRRELLVLLAAVGFVLLIACINVSSLLMARAAARQRELTVRRALGATRRRLIQQFLAESLVLVTIGGSLGVLFAQWGARALAAAAPEALLQGYDVGVDLRILGFTALVIIATALVFSLVPVFQQSDGTLTSGLREAGRGSSGSISRQRGRRVLVITEVALALVLATGSGLMMKSFVRARNVDPGFNPEHLVSFRLGLPPYRYREPQQVRQFQQQMVERLRALPGVRAASAGSHLPMSGLWQIVFSVEGSDLPNAPIAVNTIVLPQYFETLQISLASGRTFSASDVESSPSVAIINQTLAKQYFPGGALGRRIKWGGPKSPRAWSTIVGVVRDVKQRGLDMEDLPAIYFAAQQQDTMLVDLMLRSMTYIVRSSGSPAAVMSSIRTAVHHADPELPITAFGAVDEVVSLSVAGRRFNAFLLGAFAIFALALSAVGVYGLIAYAVVQRTREIGIRIAVGASRADVLRLIVGQGARLAAVGVAIGLVGSFALTRLMRTLLFDVSPLDPVTFAGAALMLLGIAVLASYAPARRAARIDPQVAIRAE